MRDVVVLVDTTYLHICGILRMLRIHHDRSDVVVSTDTTVFPKTKYLFFQTNLPGLHGHSIGTLQETERQIERT